MPYRVAVVAACPFPAPRGTPTRVLRMSEALARRGHEVHVLTYHLGEPIGETSLHVHRIRDVPGYTRTVAGPTYRKLFQLDVLLARLVSQRLVTGRFDVVYAHHYEGLLAALYGRRGAAIPVVYDAHTLLEWELTSYRLGLPEAVVARMGRWLDRALPGRADHVVAVTERIRRELTGVGGIPLNRVTVVASGVEEQYFEVSRPENASARNGKTLVFAGNLAPYQGIDLLLQAFREVRARRTDVRLLVVTTESFAPYEAQAKTLGIRDALDFAVAGGAGVIEHLAGADVALNPRLRSDGLPQKLLNYMAAGVPVVSFHGSAGPLRHDVSGCLVPDGDIAAFADGILRCLDDTEWSRGLGHEARRVARAEHSWEGAAASVESVFNTVLSSGARTG